MSLFGSTILQLPRKDSYIKWSEKQLGLLLGDTGRSFVIGFGTNYPKMVHHRARYVI